MNRKILKELLDEMPVKDFQSVLWLAQNIDLVVDYLIDNGGIFPPCKVGDVVYSIGWLNETVKEEKILYFKYNSYLNNFVFVTDMGHFDANQIGKFIFLTREAAEKTLKERDK